MGSNPISTGSDYAISVIIPSYRRGSYLVKLIVLLEPEPPVEKEIIVVDQTEVHPPAVTEQLESWRAAGRIRYIKNTLPSIPAAINRGLCLARAEVALLLDDDVIPQPGLLKAHLEAHRIHDVAVVAGRVTQPWDGKRRTSSNSHTSDADQQDFNDTSERFVSRFMAGNVSFRVAEALAVGGMDENFIGPAYRFEAEFADRLGAAGKRILYWPSARIWHVKAPHGGTNSYGVHYRTWRPHHAVGDYYYLLTAHRVARRVRKILGRPFQSCLTRFHLRRPWFIPVTLAAELAGLAWALALRVKGRRLLDGR